MAITSFILRGKVMHQRLRPAQHRFVYPVFYLRLRLDELAQLQSPWFGVNRGRPLALHEKDYGPRDGSPLLAWIQQILHSAKLPHDGPVYLQTMPRIFGFAFNPISLWYCYDQAHTLCAILAEVNNTFGQHHCYLLQAEHGGVIENDTTLIAQKLLHVSPFCDVTGNYRFRFVEKTQTSRVQIDYFDGPEKLLMTAVASKKLAWSSANLLRSLCLQPLLTIGVVWRIHWQALLLWRKRVPFFGKTAPSAQQASTLSATTVPNLNLPEITQSQK